MFDEVETLNCSVCGKNALEKPEDFNVVFDQNEEDVFMDMQVCCKENCDDKLDLPFWKDLSDFTNPYLHLQHINAMFNTIHDSQKDIFTDETLQKYKEIINKTSVFVYRDMTEKEKYDANISNLFPY